VTDVTNGTTVPEACGDPDKAALVEYVYGELDEAARARVEAHVASCGGCRLDLDQMRAARAHLAAWTVPEPEAGFATIGALAGRQVSRRYWLPAGLAAAAVLVLAAGAAIANLDIRYDETGLSVRTGWARDDARLAADRPAEAPTASAEAQPTLAAAETPWRDDLAGLERRLRSEFSTVPAPATGPTLSNAELLRQVRALIEESERRQRQELALRVAQVVRDFDAQRETDLVRIQRGLGALEGSSAADRQLLNYLMRVSTPRQ
jgi:hypothetical protein